MAIEIYAGDTVPFNSGNILKNGSGYAIPSGSTVKAALVDSSSNIVSATTKTLTSAFAGADWTNASGAIVTGRFEKTDTANITCKKVRLEIQIEETYDTWTVRSDEWTVIQGGIS